MKAKYIQLVLNSTIDLRYKRTDEINTLLETNELIRIDESFDYLIKMPMVSVSLENVEKLMKEKGDIEHELEALNRTTIQDMWLCELNNFENVYNTYIEKRTSEYSNVVQGDGVKPKKTAKKSIKK
jgi:DNA topoisomerase-2